MGFPPLRIDLSDVLDDGTVNSISVNLDDAFSILKPVGEPELGEEPL